MTVAALIQALALIGRTCRNEAGAGPAGAVATVIEVLEGSEDMTLAEWAAAKQSGAGGAAGRAANAHGPAGRLDRALETLEQAGSQAALDMVVSGLKLSAAEWQALSRKITGRSGKSGKAAREMIATHFSDRLLLAERVEGVRQQFGRVTPPLGGA